MESTIAATAIVEARALIAHHDRIPKANMCKALW
jgi:hypothetical protein